MWLQKSGVHFIRNVIGNTQRNSYFIFQCVYHSVYLIFFKLKSQVIYLLIYPLFISFIKDELGQFLIILLAISRFNQLSS